MNERKENCEHRTDEEAIDKGIEMLNAMRGKECSIVVMTNLEDGDFDALVQSTPDSMARLVCVLLGNRMAKQEFMATVIADLCAHDMADDDRVEAVDAEEGQ